MQIQYFHENALSHLEPSEVGFSRILCPGDTAVGVFLFLDKVDPRFGEHVVFEKAPHGSTKFDGVRRSSTEFDEVRRSSTEFDEVRRSSTKFELRCSGFEAPIGEHSRLCQKVTVLALLDLKCVFHVFDFQEGSRIWLIVSTSTIVE